MTKRELDAALDRLESILNNVTNNSNSNGNTAVGSMSYRHDTNPYDRNKSGEKRKYDRWEKYYDGNDSEYEKDRNEKYKLQADRITQLNELERQAMRRQEKERIISDNKVFKHQIQNYMSLTKEQRKAIDEIRAYEIDSEHRKYQEKLKYYSELKQKQKDNLKSLSEADAALVGKREKDAAKKRKHSLQEEAGYNPFAFKDVKDKGAKRMLVSGALANSTTFVGDKAAKFANAMASDKQVSISEVGDKIARVTENFGPWGKAAGALVKAFAAALELYDKINQASSTYARSVGGGVAKMQQMKYEAVGIADRISTWGGKAYKFDKILEHTAALSEKTGRVMDHMSDADFKSLEDLTQWGISNDVINQMDTFGLSVETIDKRIKEIYNSSGKHGLNAKAVTDTVTKNLQMAQRYTFAGGLRALERMAEKSVALKYNMESVAKFADKVSTLEGAAKTGAQLSVLGGNFARMGNPLSMLYGGLQDPERLNEMMLNMTKNMAHWDSELGEIRITAYNRQRLKAAADSMGVSYDDMLNQAMMQSRRSMIDNQLDTTDFNSDEREYVQNLAQIDENGKAYIKFTGSEEPTYLENMSEAQRKQLKRESEMMEDKKNAKIGDVLVQTRTITEKLNDLIDTFKTKFLKVFLSLARKWFGGNEKYAKALGLTSGNAEFFDDFVDDYEGAGLFGNAGLSASGQARLKEIYEKLGMEQDLQYERIMKNEMSTEEFMTYVAGLMSQLQDEKGLSYNGNGLFQYGQDYSLNDTSKWRTISTNENKKAYGGEIRGKGTSKSDSIPAMLSDGEFVVNSRAAQEHLPTLKSWNNARGYAEGTSDIISASEIQTNPLSVREGGSNVGYSMDIPPLKIEPINLNVSGTINLSCNGALKSIDANELLNNNMFINQLIASIESATHFGLDKTKIHMKYPVSTYMA